jgi:integrase
MNCDLRYVNSFRDRHGRWRYYFRRSGRTVALPAPAGSPAFISAYNAALMETEETSTMAPGAAPGTLDALRELYFASAEFQNLAASTRREARYVIDALCLIPNKNGGKRGDNPVARIERKHILAWRDKLKDKPGAANKMVRKVKALLSFAVERGLLADNPARGIKMLKIGSFRDWTDGELDQFEQRWPLGTIERTGFSLALYTAQRRSDLVEMRWRADQKRNATAAIIAWSNAKRKENGTV